MGYVPPPSRRERPPCAYCGGPEPLVGSCHGCGAPRFRESSLRSANIGIYLRLAEMAAFREFEDVEIPANVSCK